MNILNIHDLGETGLNQCYLELLKYYPEEQILSTTYDFEKNPKEIVFDDVYQGPFDLIVGKGFGAILALIIGTSTGTKTVLVNPMYPIQRYIREEFSDYQFADMLSSYEYKSLCWDTEKKSTADVHVILGRNDDITDTKRTPSYFHRANCHYVDGGHSPDGEDFARVFGELVGGINILGNDIDDKGDVWEENQALVYLKEFASKPDRRLLYIYGFETNQMTDAAKRLVKFLDVEKTGETHRYVSLDELPESQNGLRDEFRIVDFLVVDNIRKNLLTEGVKQSLWIACDEVLSHGGGVLLISDKTAFDLFEDDKEIMELIWTGDIKWCIESSIGSHKGLEFDMEWESSKDRRPYSETYKRMRIDDIETDNGNIVIYWSCPGEEEKSHALYLYYKNGKWYRDEEDGFAFSIDRASMILSKAARCLIEKTEYTDHDAHGFWGWGW